MIQYQRMKRTDDGAEKERKRNMKRILAAILCACLLFCTAATAETVEEDAFLIKIFNRSELKISYLHFDYYIGDEIQGTQLVCPNEGEDFYRFELAREGLYSLKKNEGLKDLRVEISYGVSDLSPEDAIIEAYMGNSVVEYPLMTLGMIPEFGKVYDLDLVSDGEQGWKLEEVKAE